MSEIRKLTDNDFREWIELSTNAYPGFGSSTETDKQKRYERLIKVQAEVPSVNFYGVFREEKLVGGMRLHDYTLNMLSAKVNAMGIGSVAVDLLHKKEKIAKEIVEYFLKTSLENNAPMALLYPFSPGFYKSMGFGAGTKMNQYKLRPSILPNTGSKENLKFYEAGDKEALIECHNSFAAKTHGMIFMDDYEFDSITGSHENKLILCKRDGKVTGYIMFYFKKAGNTNPLKNDMVVNLFIYKDTDTLMSLMTFLHSQKDQINNIVFNTQDEYFHYLFSDARDDSDNMFTLVYHETNLQGVGLMYRVLSVSELFKALANHNFNNQSCRLKITIQDSFLSQNEGSTIIHFVNGSPLVNASEGDYEAEITMDVSDFSSLIMGAVEFRALVKYGLARVSDIKYIDMLNKLFRTDEKPVCTTLF